MPKIHKTEIYLDSNLFYILTQRYTRMNFAATKNQQKKADRFAQVDMTTLSILLRRINLARLDSGSRRKLFTTMIECRCCETHREKPSIVNYDYGCWRHWHMDRSKSRSRRKNQCRCSCQYYAKILLKISTQKTQNAARMFATGNFKKAEKMLCKFSYGCFSREFQVEVVSHIRSLSVLKAYIEYLQKEELYINYSGMQESLIKRKDFNYDMWNYLEDEEYKEYEEYMRREIEEDRYY
jgi:hypothetical protein